MTRFYTELILFTMVGQLVLFQINHYHVYYNYDLFMLNYISPLDKPARLRFGHTVMVLLLYSTGIMVQSQ